MAMQAEPLTRLSEDLASGARAIARLVLADGIKTPEEERIEQIVAELRAEAAQFEEWRAVGDSFRRCGPNDHTRRLAREHGFRVLTGGRTDDPNPEAA